MDTQKDKVDPKEELKQDYIKAINEIETKSLQPKLLAMYKNQQDINDIIEKDFNEQMYTLELTYQQKYLEINNKLSVEVKKDTPIASYWLTALKNAKFSTINEKDEELLKFLTDITVELNTEDKKSFTLVFHFDKNEFFDHEKLTKTYTFDRNEDVYTKAVSTEIEFKEGKAPNVKIIKKKIKKQKTVSTITKEKEIESFFNMFKNKDEDEDEDDDDDKKETMSDDIHSEADFYLNDFLAYSMEYFLDLSKLGDIDMFGAQAEDDE